MIKEIHNTQSKTIKFINKYHYTYNCIKDGLSEFLHGVLELCSGITVLFEFLLEGANKYSKSTVILEQSSS